MKRLAVKQSRHVWLACLASVICRVGAAQNSPSVSMHDMASMSPPETSSSSMPGMEMNDNASRGMLLVDQLEFFNGYAGHGSMWEAEAWYGNDNDKLWLRTEGESSGGRIDTGDVEALWNHSISAFWGAQWGIRHDLGTGVHRNWAAIGVEGLAPYWVELEATAYLRESGRVAARARAEYTLRFTQRLILQPELEINLYDKTGVRRAEDKASDAQLGFRLRYEITRQCAPYVGLVWTRRFGSVTNLVWEGRTPAFDRQFVAGIRFWF